MVPLRFVSNVKLLIPCSETPQQIGLSIVLDPLYHLPTLHIFWRHVSGAGAHCVLEVTGSMRASLGVPNVQVCMILNALLVRLHPRGRSTIRVFLNSVAGPDFV
jgi:hypothetical protein